MLAINIDGTYISVTWAEGIKFTLNLGGSTTVIVTYSKQATLNSILNNTETIGLGVGIPFKEFISGGPTLYVSPNATITVGVQVAFGKWLLPVTVEYEYGRNKQLYKWNFSKISKTLKTHWVKGYEITKKKIDDYVRFRLKKHRLQFNVYKSGKVNAKRY